MAGIISSCKEAGETVTFLSNTVKAAIGPIQVFMGILQFWNIANIEVAAGTIFLRSSLLSLIGVMGVAVLIVAAFKTQNKTLRGVLVGLATTIGILTAAFTALRFAQIAQTIATIFQQMVLTGGTAGIVIAASIAGAAILSGIVAGLATASFQTEPGMFKKVGSTGLALVHEGETVSSPATIGEQGKLSAVGPPMIVNIFNRGDLDTNAIKRLLRKFNSMQIGSVSPAGGF